VETCLPPEVPGQSGAELERRTLKAVEPLCSPAVLLASLFSRNEEQHRLILLSGESGAGKTRWCLELIDLAKTLKIAVCGLVSPPIFEGNRKIGIDLLDLTSGERRRLAVLRREGALSSDKGPQTEDWQFDEETLDWGNQILSQCSHRLQKNPHLLILDELGPLEFLHGKGLLNALRLIDQRHYTLACVVVRPGLLPMAQQRWAWGQIIALQNSNHAGGGD
jgi:nucleoside-triphosphatase THEP1